MTNIVIWPDVSKWQVPVDNTFTRPFLMYKISEGTSYVDPHAAVNGSWCHANAGPGKKLVGHGGYHVWSPGNEQAQADLFFSNAKLSPYFVAMIDVESWGGRITGDHSASVTLLANLFAAKLGQRRVKVYGNSGDLATIDPARPSWLGAVKAGYSSQAPAEPWDGWQYTDGETKWPVPAGWPRASAPFGNCDHNAYFGTVQQFAATWGISTVAPSPAIPTGTTPAGAIRIPPTEKGQTMHLLRIDAATLPKGKPWPGVFLQGLDLSLHHVVDKASLDSYTKGGMQTIIISYAEYAAYLAEGLIRAAVKA